MISRGQVSHVYLSPCQTETSQFDYAGLPAGHIWATLQIQLVPAFAQGVGLESRQNPCQIGVFRKLPSGSADQQRWLGSSSGAYTTGVRGAGMGSRKLLNSGREMAKN
eukprot:1146678-Pelagomonas_calceolata.AAC.5